MAHPAAVTKFSATADLTRSSPGLATISPTAGVKRKRVTEQKYYAVRQGKRPGVYQTWEECLAQVRGQKGAVFKAFPSLTDAQAFMEGKQLSHSTAKHSNEPRFYAVQNGKIPGVYTDWPSAQEQIRGFRNPKHRKFNTRAEAEAFVNAGKKITGCEPSANLTPEERVRRALVQRSAPGLLANGTHPPRDRDGTEYEPGRGPLPTGSEDGFDPNIKLSPDGKVLRKTAEEKFKTKMISVEKSPPGMLKIYTDGSSLKNGQAGARAGVGVFFGPQDPKNVSEALKGTKQTNQRAELTAVLRALEIAPRHRDVTIYTDSKYAINCVTQWYKTWENNKWLNAKGKPVENKDLITDIREKIEERNYVNRDTSFIWIKGHAGDEGNVAADRLANEGAARGRGITEEVAHEEKVERFSREDHMDDEGQTERDEASEIADALRAMEEEMGDIEKEVNEFR